MAIPGGLTEDNSMLALAVTFVLTYYIFLGIYRLFLSPISSFPGPRLAALSYWYEFYYDVVCGGQYTFKIRELHDEYGPIIRISPAALHILDPEYYDTLYAGGSSKRNKWYWSARMFGEAPSAFSTIPHDHHRLRRAALNPYFSKQSVQKLEPVIRESVLKLCGRFEASRKTGEPVNLGHAYAALTMDVITKYSFGHSYNCLDAPDFRHYWPDTIDSLSKGSHLNKQFGWLLPLLKQIPFWIVRRANPNLMSQIELQLDQVAQVKKISAEKIEPKSAGENPTIFHELFNSNLPPHEKTIERLSAEGQSLTAAGQVTTAYFLKTVHYHIISNPSVLDRLQSELQTVNKQGLPALRTLEQLPYLIAVINEGYRLSYGIVQRLLRISPNEPLQFHEWTIPPGTPVGMSALFMHEDEAKFPNPRKFDPERWLQPDSKSLERYLVNFSKGSRGCLGLNLAKAEIFITLAAVFGGAFKFELFDTTRERDVDVSHDYFNPQPRGDSKGIRVVVL